MKIINDTIEFETADAQALSEETQAALVNYNGAESAEAALSDVVNAHVALARATVISREVDSVKSALVAASAADRASALGKIDEAKTILGVQFSPKLAMKG